MHTRRTLLTDMKQQFPDVKEGDRITGLHLPGVGARLFVNGQLQGEPRDALLGKPR